MVWIASATALAFSPSTRADQSGVPFWFSGSYASLAAIPPNLGWSLPLQGYYYSGDASRTKSFSHGDSVTSGICIGAYGWQRTGLPCVSGLRFAVAPKSLVWNSYPSGFTIGQTTAPISPLSAQREPALPSVALARPRIQSSLVDACLEQLSVVEEVTKAICKLSGILSLLPLLGSPKTVTRTRLSWRSTKVDWHEARMPSASQPPHADPGSRLVPSGEA